MRSALPRLITDSIAAGTRRSHSCSRSSAPSSTKVPCGKSLTPPVAPMWLFRNSIGRPSSFTTAPSRSITRDHLHAVLLGEELRGVVADVAEALHDRPLALEPAGEPRPLHVLGVAEELAERVLDAAPGGLDPAGDAAGVQRLAGDAGGGVDVGGVHPAVLVDDPGHLALAGAHVGGRDVLARVDQVALGELVGEAAGDLLHLVLVPFARVDPQAPLGAAERHLDQRALVGHQRRQRLHLVLVDVRGVADAALDRLHVLGMHAAVAGEGVDRASEPHAEAHHVGRVADPDLLLEPGREIHEPHGPVEHEVDGFAKARLAERRVHD